MLLKKQNRTDVRFFTEVTIWRQWNKMETTITGARKERMTKQVHFTLCGSCYWCASYLDGRGVETCPACTSGRVETIPVAGTETYVFH